MSGKKNNDGLKAFIVVVIALAAMLVSVEVGLRLVEKTGAFSSFYQGLGKAKPPLDRRTGPGMFYAHHYTGYALKPNYQREPFERINNVGFRGGDIALEKPEGVYRIVALGGSTTFAVYLPWTESYPYYLQEELRERLGTDKIEVINGGLTGSTSGESFHRLATQVLPVDPDMIIIYHAYNDLLPRVFDDYQDDYYHFRKSDPNSPPGMTRFYLYRLALSVLSPGFFHENYNLMGQVWKIENLPSTDTERTQNFLDSNNDAFAFNMDNMVTLAKAKGVDVVLASFAIRNDIWHWMDYLPPYLWEIGIAENNVVIREIAERQNVPLVPFAEAPFLEGFNVHNSKMFNDSIHMTAEGNQFKAEIFADTIAPAVAKAMGLPVPAPSQYSAVKMSVDVSASAPEESL
jgi:lysophospholipase L1-like esterase